MEAGQLAKVDFLVTEQGLGTTLTTTRTTPRQKSTRAEDIKTVGVSTRKALSS